MAYGINAPFGLKIVDHMISGTDNIKPNKKYTISANSASINCGDPVIYTPQGAQQTGTGLSQIMAYVPVVNIQTGGNATTVFPSDMNNGSLNYKTILGVFQGCEYIDDKGYPQYLPNWVAGTQIKAGTQVTALVIDDPYVIYSIQLSTFTGAGVAVNGVTPFLNNPGIYLQSGANALASRSSIIGTNIEMCVGSAPTGTSLGTVTYNPVNGGAPVAAGTYTNNPTVSTSGTSLYYGCTSIAASMANNGAAPVFDNRNEYNRATSPLTIIGFSKNNVVPNGATYFTTPFLNVDVIINNHANKAPTTGVIVA